MLYSTNIIIYYYVVLLHTLKVLVVSSVFLGCRSILVLTVCSFVPLEATRPGVALGASGPTVVSHMAKSAKKQARKQEGVRASEPIVEAEKLLGRTTARRFSVQILSMLCLLGAWRLGILRPSAAVRKVSRRPTAMRFSKTLGAGHFEPFVLQHPLGLPAWDTSIIATEMGNLTGVKVSQDGVFGPTFDASRYLANVRGKVNPRHIYKEVNMTARNFFARASMTRHQYSREVSVDLPLHMRESLNYLESEIVAIYPSSSSITLDLEREGSVTPCHYNAGHTVVTLSDGAKKFTLLPPDQANGLRIFPHLHPSSGWCRSSLGEAPTKALAAAQAMEVTLTSGELLYIPPMWIVETVAELPSVGIVGHCESAPERVLKDLKRVKRPWSSRAGSVEVDGSDAAKGPLRWLRQLQANAAADGSARPVASSEEQVVDGDREVVAAWFVDELSLGALGSRAALGSVVHCSRYQWLVDDGELIDPHARTSSDQTELLPPRICEAVQNHAALVGEARAAWEAYLLRLVAIVTSSSRLDGRDMATLLADLVEEVVAEAVPAERLAGFWRELYQCTSGSTEAAWIPRC